MRALQPGRTFRRVASMFAVTALAVTIASPALAFSQCMPRVMSKNIKEAVLAMRAAQYCPGLPYTIDQAAHQVEDMRCNDEASGLVDHLLSRDAEYKLLLTGSAAEITCAEAAKISLAR